MEMLRLETERMAAASKGALGVDLGQVEYIQLYSVGWRNVALLGLS